MKNIHVLISFIAFGMYSCDDIAEQITESATESIIEMAIGDSVDVEFTGNDEGVNFSIKTENGTTSMEMGNRELPEDFPKGVFLVPDAKRGMVAIIDTPDGKMVAFQDTLSMSLKEAQEKIRNNMTGFKLEFETSSDIYANFMYSRDDIESFTLGLNTYEGVILVNYGIMYKTIK